MSVVVDVGANIGSASVYFGLQYPHADIWCFEPNPTAYALLQQNALHLPNLRPHNIGLFNRDCETLLHLGSEDAATSSIGASYLNGARSVPVQLRDAGTFFREQQLDGKIDILKIDTEGCELPILQSLAETLDRIKVIYLEFHDEADRLAIDAMLRRTHILTHAHLRHPHRGELCYVAYHAFPSPAAIDNLRIRRDSLPLTMATPATPALNMLAPSETLADQQSPFEVAVVMPTILRPSLKRAVQSVFEQQFTGRGQLLIGIDRAVGDRAILDEIQAMKHEHWALSIFDPGYSTSVRHGGLHPAEDGGALRTILSYAANSRYVAYLDDDNWWGPDHLRSLLDAIQGHDWAYSARWFVDPDTLEPLCEDTWESVGPDQGVFKNPQGGFVDPNTLLLDKLACESVLRLWSIPMPGDRRKMSADRNVFQSLRTQFKAGATGKATCYYCINPADEVHGPRMKHIKKVLNQAESSPPNS